MMKVIYNGDLRTKAIHLKSNSELITDAPVDNEGKGANFSPTDLVATALGSCMLTIMGIKAKSLKINIEGAEVVINKIMTSNPRRIAEIKLEIGLPKNYTDEVKKSLESAALACPVAKSLHSDLKQSVSFNYPN